MLSLVLRGKKLQVILKSSRLLRAPYLLGAPLALALLPKIKSAARARALTIKERRSFCALKNFSFQRKMAFYAQNYQVSFVANLECLLRVGAPNTRHTSNVT